MRHVVAGLDIMSSTSDEHHAARFREIVEVMDKITELLRLTPVAGLQNRHGRAL